MRRNWDLVRTLLISLDPQVSPDASSELIQAVRERDGEDVIDRHLLLMAEAGWLTFDFDSDKCKITSEGLDTLELMKDDDSWLRLRRIFDGEDRQLSISCDVLIFALKAFYLDKQAQENA
jgi:hypothetical protein